MLIKHRYKINLKIFYKINYLIKINKIKKRNKLIYNLLLLIMMIYVKNKKYMFLIWVNTLNHYSN